MSRRPDRLTVTILAAAALGAAVLGGQAALTAGDDTPATAVRVAPDYQPDAFRFWSDLDGNGCDAREDVLRRDATEATDSDGDGCIGAGDRIVVDGPYTGRRLTDTAGIDVDHVVSRADAWRSGAWRWSDDAREIFANDLDNLLAVDDGENSSKSDQDPGTYRPPQQTAWCDYARIYRTVKHDYGLTVTAGQSAGLDELGAACGVHVKPDVEEMAPGG